MHSLVQPAPRDRKGGRERDGMRERRLKNLRQVAMKEANKKLREKQISMTLSQ